MFSEKMYSKLSLEDLISKSSDYDQNKIDHNQNTSLINFDDNGRLHVAGGMFENFDYSLEDWALKQVCTKLTVPHSYVVRCPDTLASINLNYWKGQKPNDWFVRCHGDNVRAVLSKRYTPVSNTDLLKTVRKMIGGTNYGLIRPTVGRDSIYLRVIVATRNTVDNTYGVGFTLRNGETGNYKIEVSPFIQRTSCTNSISHLEGGFSMRHIGLGKVGFNTLVIDAVGKAIQAAPEMVNQMIEAESMELPDIGNIIDKLTERHGFSEVVNTSMKIGTEGSHTIAGLVNGLSFAAHNALGIQEDDMVKLEHMAGAVLYDYSLEVLR